MIILTRFQGYRIRKKLLNSKRIWRLSIILIGMLNVSLVYSAILPDTSAVELLRYPYLQAALGDSITIVWKTNKSQHCSILLRWKEESSWEVINGTVHKSKIGFQNAVTVRQLVSSSVYQYKIFTNGQELCSNDSMFFSSPVSEHDNFSFFAAGDIGEPVGEGGKPDQMANSILGLKDQPNFGLLLGDIVYDNGNSEDYDNHLFPHFKNVFSAIPVFAVLGNHDWHVNPDENFLTEWKLPGNEHYYSFNYGNTHFIGLDSKDGTFFEFEKQFIWLQEDLKSAQGKYQWIIVFLHHNGKSCTYKEDYSNVVKLYPLFDQYNVDLVLNGHAHTYERLNPMDGNGIPILRWINESEYTNPEGFISITAGSGGKLRGVGSDPTPYTPDPDHCVHSNLVSCAKHVWAYLQISIKGNRLYTLAIDSTTGWICDSFSITKDAVPVANYNK
jgi:hypothetical protein